ncbi:MAG: four helix bundle protein [Sedimentisphaerales bacterium]|nr:four helix bundle protein [Sedimentisphaerales bacterium]
MTKTQNPKQYDLEDRTLKFAKRTREFIRRIDRTLANIEDSKQLIRSSGSIGANYIEANEALSKKDFAMRVKICRKEAKESRYWLQLVNTDGKNDLEQEKHALQEEARELTHIFGSIVTKST